MKAFRKQFIECCDDGTRIEKKLEKPQIIYPFGYPIFRKSITLNTIGWCNKFNEACTSEVCKELRSSL